MLLLGTVPSVVIGGGLTPDQYEGLGSFWRINDWKKALHKITTVINRTLPKPLRSVVEKVNAKVEHIDAKVSERFINLKHWSQNHRALSILIIATILSMGAASFLAGGFAAGMSSWGAAVAHGLGVAGSGIASGASYVATALSGHTALSIFAAVAPSLIQTLKAKQAAGQQLSPQDLATLQQAQAVSAMDPGMMAAMQGGGGFGGGGGGGSYGPSASGAMPPVSDLSNALPLPPTHSMTVPLLIGGGVLLFFLLR